MTIVAAVLLTAIGWYIGELIGRWLVRWRAARVVDRSASLQMENVLLREALNVAAEALDRSARSLGSLAKSAWTCGRCLSGIPQGRGYAVSDTSSWERRQCLNCEAWTRSLDRHRWMLT